MADDRRLLLGYVSGAHGVRGEVLVRSYTADPAAIGDYGPLSDARGARAIDLRVVRVTTKGVVARIRGIGDRNEAEALRGLELYAPAHRLPAPADGEFYHADLIGLTAVTSEGATVGEIIAVHNFGAGDIIEIRLAGGRQTELVPFTDRFVPEVDLAGRRALVVMPVSDDDDAPPAATRKSP